MNKTHDRLVFISLFFEALKPHATSILDTCIDIADAAVSATTRAQVRSAESVGSINADTL